MIDIKIDEDYKIVSDERNITLKHKRIITGDNTVGKQANPDNIGKEVFEDISFHRTIRGAIEDYARERVLKSNAKTFEELYRLLDEIKNVISKIKDIDNLIDKSVIKNVVVEDKDSKVNDGVKVGRNKNERIATEKDKKNDKKSNVKSDKFSEKKKSDKETKK